MPDSPEFRARLSSAATRLDVLSGHLRDVESQCELLTTQILAQIAGTAGQEDRQIITWLHEAGAQARQAADRASTAVRELRQLAAVPR